MERQESNYSDMQSDIKRDLYSTNKPRKTQTWKSAAGDAHTRVMAEYLAEVPEEPKQIHNAWTYLIGVIMCMGAAAYGYDTGFFGGTLALDSFKRDFKMSERSSTTQANLVSLFQGGSFFGAGLQLPLTEKFGRKWTIIFANVIFIASAFAQTFSNGSVEVFMVGRFLGGFAVGFLSLIIPVYLAEFAPPSIRGRLVGFFDIFIQVGTLAGFWINYGIDATLPSNTFQWQLPVFVQFFPAALLGVGAFFVPETPRWLMSKGRYDDALKSLVNIRRLPADHAYIQYEIKMTHESVETERAHRGDATLWGLVKELASSKGHRKRVGLGLALIFFKTFSGVQAVNYYSPRIFKQLGFKGTKNSLFATGIYGTVKFVGTLIFGFFVVDRVGRRWPLIIGSLGLSGCLIYIGGYLTAMGPRDGTQPISKGDYTAIVAIFLYATWYCFGWNSVPLTLISEIFNIRYRTISMTICLMWQWLCTFSIVRIMPIALDTITTKTYFLFGGIFLCAAPFCYFFIPETKKLSLEYIDRLFDGDAHTPRDDVEAAVPETEYKPEMDHIERLAPVKE